MDINEQRLEIKHAVRKALDKLDGGPDYEPSERHEVWVVPKGISKVPTSNVFDAEVDRGHWEAIGEPWDAHKWITDTANMLRDAIGPGEAETFILVAGNGEHNDRSYLNETFHPIQARTWLENLIVRLDHVTPAPSFVGASGKKV